MHARHLNGIGLARRRNGYCLSGILSCTPLTGQCEGADPSSDVGRLCTLQKAFCNGSQAGQKVRAYWGSIERCPQGVSADAFPAHPGLLTQLTCCASDNCNQPGTPPPAPKCTSVSVKPEAGYCKDRVLAFKTCSVGPELAMGEAHAVKMVSARRRAAQGRRLMLRRVRLADSPL